MKIYSVYFYTKTKFRARPGDAKRNNRWANMWITSEHDSQLTHIDVVY